MSAFIVSDSCMQKAVRAVVLVEGDTMECAAMDQIGRDMWQLNAQAVRSRYEDAEEFFGEDLKAAEAPEAWTYNGKTVVFRPSIEERCVALKALWCFLYQCAEGDIPQRSELFQRLDRTALDLCKSIVTDLPAFEAAPWGE